ncbi:hypothetical protein HKX48_009255 [Thoreauomyces humboldtii]|nr:hypothetical protein HKX48_009255 [Thoreauomyces humboldtii]
MSATSESSQVAALAEQSTVPHEEAVVKAPPASVRGKPVSGKVWKTQQEKRHTSMRPRMLRQGWEKQMEERKRRDILKTIEGELKAQTAAEKQKRKEATIERHKRKAENEKKGEVVQKVSAGKVKRMKKKQLRQIRKA